MSSALLADAKTCFIIVKSMRIGVLGVLGLLWCMRKKWPAARLLVLDLERNDASVLMDRIKLLAMKLRDA